MENTRQYPNNKYNSSGVRRDDQRDLDIIFGHLPDDNIFTKCGKGFAGGYSTDWLKPDNFLSKKEAREWISEGGNIGLAIGRFFGDTAYVNFDIDSPDALEGEARAILESHAPFKISTKHNNTNYIVSVDNREALEILDAYPTTLDHLSDGESDDLEIFANQFHALIPPSKVHHRTCSGSKPCSPSDGQGRYLFQSVNKNSKPLSLSTVERLGELWKIEPEVIGSSYPEPDETANVPSVGPSVNVIKEFQENVPHIKHDFQQRQEYMKNGDWNGQDLFRQLWHGNFNNVSGSNPQGTAECKLANYIGFFFGRNEEIIKYFMSSLPFETHYEQYDTHRKILLDFAMSVDWVYCEGVSFAAKAEVAYAISKEGRTTVQEIKQITSIQERHIQYIIQILKAEGVIDVHTENHGEYIITNEGIVEEYLRDIESVIAEYEGEECSIKVDKSHPNTRMVPI